MVEPNRRQMLRALSGTVLGIRGVTSPARTLAIDLPDSRLVQETETVIRFRQTAKLAADDGDEQDKFGNSVSLSNDGTTAIIGAHSDINSTGLEGSAYIFERSDEVWKQKQKITAPDDYTGNLFGNSVALSGNGMTAIVGGQPRNDDRKGSGSVYIFKRSENLWHQQQKLIPDDSDGNNWLGPAMSVSDDGMTAIIAAYTDPDPNDDKGVGSAYVFEVSDDSWERAEELTIEDPDEAIDFGVSVGISGDGTTAVIGSPSNDATGERTSSAYIFERAGNAWDQQQKLVSNDGDKQDAFGREVAVSRDGTTTIICAPQDETDVEGSGSAYIFERSEGSWHQQQRLVPKDNGGTFAQAVAVSGNGTTVFVGSRAADPNGPLSGAAYLFERSGAGWQQILTPNDGDPRDRFGESVSISSDGRTALSGAFWDEGPHGNRSGSAYVFEKAEVTLTPTPTPVDDESGDATGPGLWIGTAVAGLGAGIYLLKRYFTDRDVKQD